MTLRPKPERSPPSCLLLASLLAALAIGCHSLPPPTPLDQLTPAQAQGHAVYTAQCAACHYDRHSGALHGPTLAGLFKKPALPSGAAATDERVSATILHGRGNMPAFAAKLDAAELDNLLAYLHTL